MPHEQRTAFAPVIDFRCKVCGVACDVAPIDGSGAICPAHCEDHDFNYDRDLREHVCAHCDMPAPDDWYDND